MKNIVFESLHFKASEHLENFVGNKVDKLFHINPKIIRANVTLYKGAANNLNNKWCKIRLVVTGNDFIAKKSTAAYEQSILETVSALQKKLRRDNTNHINKKELQVLD